MQAPFLFAAALLLGEAATAMQDDGLHFTEDSSKGFCRARVWGGVTLAESGQGVTIEFDYRVADGSLSAMVMTQDWKRAQEADPGINIPMTLTLDGQPSEPSAEGGYDSPYYDSAWGAWGPAQSRKLLAGLKTAKTALVRFEGSNIGPFRLPAGGKMYNALIDCAARVRAGKQ